MPELILASASPRRRELLSMVGIAHTVRVTGGDESTDKTDPAEAVADIARRKASLARRETGEWILAADTMVLLDGRFLGKPSDEGEAFSMLSALSGREHVVYTGVCLDAGGKIYSETVCTSVRFRALTERDIRRYIRTKEPMDKAGAYGIQGPGALLVEEIRGDFYNVMGLPLVTVWRLLEKAGYPGL